MGVVDGLALDVRQRERLQVTFRQELRRLTHNFGMTETRRFARRMSGRFDKTRRVDPFELMLTWCATPAIPTYRVGVQIGLETEDKELQEAQRIASALAWVFRLLCSRSGINARKDAPVLSAACEAICSNKKEMLIKMKE